MRLVMPRKYFSMNLQEKLSSFNLDGDISVAFRLASIILHHGAMAVKGHYTAVVLDASNQVSQILDSWCIGIVNDEMNAVEAL
jgi:uncharacterized UBP type Zn finger protein